MHRKHSHLLIGFAMAALYPQIAMADNGALAYAVPTQSLTVDGDLSDWPASSESVPIALGAFGTLEDFSANFRVAYDSAKGDLYVGVVVDDANPIGDPMEADFNWVAQDTHIVMLDAEHRETGGGPVSFMASDQRHDENPQQRGWDPKMNKRSGFDTESAVSTQDGTIVYEWRIRAGETIKPGRTIGMDHIVIDVDQVGARPSQAALWGPSSRKTDRAGRMGDVVLLPPETALGTLRGQMAWAEGLNGRDLDDRPVRIKDAEGSPLWVQVKTDVAGQYELRLPVGNYTVTSPVSLHKSRPQDAGSGTYDIRLPDDLSVSASVIEGKIVRAPLLELTNVPAPALPDDGPVLFNFTPDKKAKFEHVIKELMDHYQIGGASIALVSDGEIRYAGGFGVRNEYTQEPVIDSTLFEAASVTKITFAFAVNRMAERGEIDLDKPLYDYVPFEGIAHNEQRNLITARHALSHTTGLPNWAWMSDSGQLDIGFTPGTDFSYSGAGFEYLAEVVETLQGRPLAEILMADFQMPMGQVGNTIYYDTGTLLDRIAFGDVLNYADEPNFIAAPSVAFSMLTNAPALANFMTALMRQDGLSDAGYEEMLRAHIRVPHPEDDMGWDVDYSLGFRLMSTPYGRAIGHDGLNDSNHALFEYYEDHRSGFVVLTNSDSGRDFYRALRRYLIGEIKN